MSEQIEKLVQDIQRLSKHIAEDSTDASLLETRTSVILEKMVRLQKICGDCHRDMREDLKRKDKEIRKMKKIMKEEQEQNSQLRLTNSKMMRDKNKNKGKEKRESVDEEKFEELQKAERKYSSAKKQLSDKKAKIEELEEKVSKLEGENQELKTENEKKELLIRNLSQENQLLQENLLNYEIASTELTENVSSTASSRKTMSFTENGIIDPQDENYEEQFEEENLKEEDDEETDDQFDDEFSEEEEIHVEKVQVKVEVDVEEEILEVESDEEGREQQVEKKHWLKGAMRKVFWFLE